MLRGMPPLGANGGHRAAPGPTRNRAPAHQTEADLAADGTPTTPHRADSFICGGSAAHRRCGTRNKVSVLLKMGSMGDTTVEKDSDCDVDHGVGDVEDMPMHRFGFPNASARGALVGGGGSLRIGGG